MRSPEEIVGAVTRRAREIAANDEAIRDPEVARIVTEAERAARELGRLALECARDLTQAAALLGTPGLQRLRGHGIQQDLDIARRMVHSAVALLENRDPIERFVTEIRATTRTTLRRQPNLVPAWRRRLGELTSWRRPDPRLTHAQFVAPRWIWSKIQAAQERGELAAEPETLPTLPRPAAPFRVKKDWDPRGDVPPAA